MKKRINKKKNRKFWFLLFYFIFSFLGLKFSIFWPQIRIPCKKLYTWPNVDQQTWKSRQIIKKTKLFYTLSGVWPDFGYIYSFWQGIRIWGQKTPNFRPRREKSGISNFTKKSKNPIFWFDVLKFEPGVIKVWA